MSSDPLSRLLAELDAQDQSSVADDTTHSFTPDAPNKGCLRSTEETLAELRRENFRLRINCYNYTEKIKELTTKSDPKLTSFNNQADLIKLKEQLNKKQNLLTSASGMIDSLKEENGDLLERVKECEDEIAAWKLKYDTMINLPKSHSNQGVIDMNDNQHITDELENKLKFLQLDNATLHSELGKRDAEIRDLNEMNAKYQSDTKQLLDQQVLCSTCQHSVPENLEEVGNKQTVASKTESSTDPPIERRFEAARLIIKKMADERFKLKDKIESLETALQRARSSPHQLSNPSSFDRSENIGNPTNISLDDISNSSLSVEVSALSDRQPLGDLSNMTDKADRKLTDQKELSIALSKFATPINDSSRMQLEELPPSLNRLRTLYTVVRDLMGRLDNIRFSQNSFVDMINKSLSTAFADNQPVAVDNPHRPSGDDESSFLDMGGMVEQLNQSLINCLSRADATYGGDGESGKLLADSLTFDQTLPQLQQWPDSPARNTSLLLNRSGGDDWQLNLSIFNASRSIINYGDLTMVESRNRQLCDRLSLAMLKLRSAIEEWSTVSDVFNQVGNLQLEQSLVGDQASFLQLEGRQSPPNKEASVCFDAASIMPNQQQQQAITPQSATDQLSQLYGSAWKGSKSLCQLPNMDHTKPRILQRSAIEFLNITPLEKQNGQADNLINSPPITDASHEKEASVARSLSDHIASIDRMHLQLRDQLLNVLPLLESPTEQKPDLPDLVNQITREVDQLRASNHLLTARETELKEQLRLSSTQLAEITSNLNRLTCILSTHLPSLSGANSDETLIDRVDKLLTDQSETLANYSRDLDNARQAVCHSLSIQFNVDASNKDLAGLLHELDQYRCQQLTDCQQELVAVNDKLADVVERCEDRDDQLLTSIGQLINFEEEEEATLESAIDCLCHQLAEERVNSNNLQHHLDSVAGERAELECQLASSQANLETMGQQLESTMTEHWTTKGQLESTSSQLALSRLESEKAQAAFNDVKQQADNLSQQLTQSQSLVDQLDARCRELEAAECQIHKVDTQTSPITNNDDGVNYESKQSLEASLGRSKKYSELKAIAFELKDKLVQRTDKLNSSVKEVVRLRLIIQQDKERVKQTLADVEDLIKQVKIKNERIHELELQLASLRPGTCVPSRPIPRSPKSPPLASPNASIPEQHRGAELTWSPLLEISSRPPVIMDSPPPLRKFQTPPRPRSALHRTSCRRCKSIQAFVVQLKQISSQLCGQANASVAGNNLALARWAADGSRITTRRCSSDPLLLFCDPAIDQSTRHSQDDSLAALRHDLQSLYEAHTGLVCTATKLDLLCNQLIYQYESLCSPVSLHVDDYDKKNVRHFQEIAHGLDSITKTITQTSVVLKTTRSNLESVICSRQSNIQHRRGDSL